jgi:hypothetical protein
MEHHESFFFPASVYQRFYSRSKVPLIDGLYNFDPWPLLSGTPAVRDAIPSDYVINIRRVLYIYICIES